MRRRDGISFYKTITYIVVLVLVCRSAEAVEADILFCLQDMGETEALLPVLQRLEVLEKPYVVVAGTAAQKILKGNISISRVMSFLECGIEMDPVVPRETRLAEKEVRKMVRTIKPKAVVTGVAYRFYGQILDAYNAMGIPTIAYWDNFSASGANSYFKIAHEVIRKGSRTFFPSKDVAFDGSFSDIDVESRMVVGQPSLEAWRNLLPLKKEGKSLVYIGGYGTEYEEGFDLFLKALEHKAFSVYRIIVKVHPKVNGAFEKKRIEALKFYLPQIEVMVEGDTREVVREADVVVCYQSTVGFQAASGGKRVIYLMPQTHVFSNPVIDKGIAKLTHTEEAFRKAIFSLEKLPNFSEVMHLPEDSTDTVLHALLYFSQVGIGEGS